LYGKVYAGGQGRLVGPAVTALREHPLDASGASLPFLVPRFQAYLPDLRLVLLEAIPGSPLLPALIRAPDDGAASAVAGRSVGPAVAACARMAVALHRSSVPVATTRTLSGEIEGAGAAVDNLAPLAPAFAASLHRRLRASGDLALDPAGTPGVVHGDFRPSQVLFDGPTAGLVDFDTMCRGEPALDLGQFTAYLAVAVSRPASVAWQDRAGRDDLETRFLHEYLRLSGSSDPDLLLARVAAYRTVALVRLAVRRWCQLEPQRLRPVLALLDEPQRIGVP
jgi:hypothetical protein